MTSMFLWKYRLLEPHAVFWLTCLFVKVALPSFLKWLAYDKRIATWMLSVGFPLVATICLIHRESQPSSPRLAQSVAAAKERRFWIDYWVAGYSLAQLIHQSLLLMPISLRSRFQYSYFLSQIMAEVKFLFFVWIFAMEPVLKKYQQVLALDQKEGGEKVQAFLPLTLIKRAMRPFLLDIQSMVSNPISKENWDRLIHSKAQRVLNMLVALQFLTEEGSEYLLQLLDECRSLLLLSPFLVLPAPITRLGILYPQFVLPAARSLLARGKIIEVLYLQYWILNICLATFLNLGSWVWWFVPFSTQVAFAAWCYLTFPRTITEYYAVIEQELITFGILPGESQLLVEETKTAQALRAIIKRLPSANDAEGFRWATGSGTGTVDSRYGQVSNRKLVPRSQSAPATLLAISAIKALHDSAILSPQQEAYEDDEQEEDCFIEFRLKPSTGAKLPNVLPENGCNNYTHPPPFQQESFSNNTYDSLPPSISILEESDESSHLSTSAMVNIDLSTDNQNVNEELEVTLKELSAARLKVAKYEPKAAPNHSNFTRPLPYQRPLRRSVVSVISNEQKLRPRLSGLAPRPTTVLSARSAFDTHTPRSKGGGAFDLSIIDSVGIRGTESFDTMGAFHEGSNRDSLYLGKPPTIGASPASRSRSNTLDDIANRVARRSERIRKLQENQEQRKIDISESLQFIRSTTTDEPEGEKAVAALVSKTSTSIGNKDVVQLVANNRINEAMSTNRTHRRSERSSDSEPSFTEMHRTRHNSSFPKDVRMESTDLVGRERRARRSRSRDNVMFLSDQSAKVAQ